MTSPWSTDLLATDVITRARTATTMFVRYRLGAGGRDPRSESPADEHSECDCSGFVAWCLGLARKVTHPAYVRFNGGWLSTDAMVHDALSVGGILDAVTPDDVRAGDVAVYGNGPRVGHCAIMESARTGQGTAGRHFDGDAGWRVIDCAARGIRERSFWDFAARASTTIHLLRFTGWRP